MNYSEEEKNTSGSVFGISIGTIGLITFIVFLVLKLCNQNNPDFEWLTWFWVWFPLWIPIASTIAICLLVIVVVLIISLFTKER